MPTLVKIDQRVINLDVCVEAERRSDGSVVLSCVNAATVILSRGAETDLFWEMLQGASRTPKDIAAEVDVRTARL